MFDRHPLLGAVAVAIAVCIAFAIAAWTARWKAGQRGLVMTWLVASLQGFAFLLVLLPPREGGIEPVIETLLVPMFVFGAGVFFLEGSVARSRGHSHSGTTEPSHVSLGRILRVTLVMLLAFYSASAPTFGPWRISRADTVPRCRGPAARRVAGLAVSPMATPRLRAPSPRPAGGTNLRDGT
jgi:hypothetical protein